MNTTTLPSTGEILARVFSLDTVAFQVASTIPGGSKLAILIVLLAGISLGVGQSIVLFLNQVKPGRFIFSLLLNAILYTFGFLFLVLSTWLICQLPWNRTVQFLPLVKVLGLSYVPLLFGFLGALPYLGGPILTLLSVWRLLAMVVGFSAISGASIPGAFGYVALGWGALQLLESTIGQPVAQFGKVLADRVAGVELSTDRRELKERMEARMEEFAEAFLQPNPSASADVRQLMQVAGRSSPEAAQSVAQAIANRSTASLAIAPQTTLTDSPMLVKERSLEIPQRIKVLAALVGMAILFVVILVLLEPIRNSLFGWYNNLPRLFRFVFDLVWIGVVAIVFAGLLAPLETLGWWAGWYGDDIETVDDGLDNLAITPSAPPNDKPISRYVVYLDGIGQSGEEYTPDVMDFLNALKPSLPEDVELVQGLMMYSVLNKPLDEDRPLAFVWRMADKMRWKNPAALLGFVLNLRNVLIVAVSADKRYGPIYNQGIAQVLYNGLIARGYQPGSGVPITLIGYSGGGEMSTASAPYLKRATGAPIDIISLGGVMSARSNFLKLEHLYHLVGDKDFVERSGPIMFPGRWKVFPLSYWNRAKRQGKISIISLGPVGHQVPGGMMDPNATLPDGRTYLQNTIEHILQILNGELVGAVQRIPRKPSNYQLYKQAAFNDPAYYPLTQSVDFTLYQPIAPWMGRLILPQCKERHQVKGVWFEVHHAPAEYHHLVGKRVKLRWTDHPFIRRMVQAVRRDVYFSANAEFTSKYGGLVHPERLDRWQQVGPLESLAGSHPTDDIVVSLNDPVQVEGNEALYISSLPVQITGRYYALVQFVAPIAGTDHIRVVHFNRTDRQFNGPQEVVRMPPVIADQNGCFPSVTRDIERSPLNETGWYIYGAKDPNGMFLVQSYAPRSLLCLQPERVLFGRKQGYHYIRKQAWGNIKAQKGRISSVLLSAQEMGIQEAIQNWQEGDRALVLHTYGGIGGKKKEPAAAAPIFFGHFAYGLARVVREPLANELQFDIRYHQVYTHNTDGLVAGTLHWSRYLGDRQFGWGGTRPVCDILIKLDAFTGFFNPNSSTSSVLTGMLSQLQVMTSRYRIGDGTGGTYVGPANNCSQDSNQALFASIRWLEKTIQRDETQIQRWLSQEPEQAQKFEQLMRLGKQLQRELQPLGGPRSDWEKNEYNLGTTLEDNPLQNLLTGLGSWRTLLPRLASDTIVRVFLKEGADVWVLRTNQIGGYDPDIEPIAPITF